MKKLITYYLLTVLFYCFQVEGQVIYDTIPDDILEIGGFFPDEMMVFKDSGSLIYENCQIKDLPANYQQKGSVIISTVFGKNGLLLDTKVVMSINPIYDSIAFYRIQSIDGWMPGMLRGKFVNIPVILPIQFENGSIVNSNRLLSVFGKYVSEEEYSNREKIYDFLHSEEPSQSITSNDYIFKYFLANHLNENGTAFIDNYTRPNLFKSAYIKTNLSSKEDILYIISKNHKYRIEENKYPKRILLEKGKDYLLIAFKKTNGKQPQISIKSIDISKRMDINFKFEYYDKTRLIKELMMYAP